MYVKVVTIFYTLVLNKYFTGKLIITKENNSRQVIRDNSFPKKIIQKGKSDAIALKPWITE